MARDPKQKRKIYEGMIGKDLADKLSDAQIDLLSKYYNSLDDKESSDLDSRIMMGYNDTPLHDMARDMAGEEEDEEEPEGLDDILGDIRAEKVVEDTQENLDENLKSTSDSIMDDIDRIINEYQEKVRQGKEVGRGTSGALATIPRRSNYQEKGTDKEVEENIDPKILELLGLEDTTDFTYDEYKTLLREKMVAGRMADSEMSSEDTELLTDEFKRVRSNTGEFVIKSDRGINFGSSVKEGSGVYNRPPESETKEEKASVISSLPASLDSISSALVSIADIIKVDVAVEEKENDIEEKNELEKERKAEEAKNEIKKSKKGFKFPQIKLPKFDFLDMIKRYIGNILAGGALLAALKWLQDPKNQEKVDGFVDFIVEHAPLILGGILALLALPIASTILGVLGAVGSALTSLIGIVGALSPVLLPLLAAAGLTLLDQRPAGGNDQLYGKEAAYLKEGTTPEQQIEIIDSMSSEGTTLYQDLSEWPKSMVDTYAEAHKKLDKPLPKWFIDQRSSGKQGKTDIESEQMQGPSLEGVDEERQKQIEELKEKLANLEARLRLQKSSGMADPRSVKQTEKQIADIEDRMSELGYKPPTGSSEETSAEVRPDGKMSNFDYYSANHNLDYIEKGGGRNDLKIAGVGTVRRDSGFLGMGEERLRYYDQDTGEEISSEDFRKKLDSMKPEGYDTQNIRKGNQTSEPQPFTTVPTEEIPTDPKEMEEYIKRLDSGELTKPQPANVNKSASPVVPPRQPPPGTTTVLPISSPNNNKSSVASTSGGNKQAPSFAATDPNNQTTPVVRSILNLNN